MHNETRTESRRSGAIHDNFLTWSSVSIRVKAVERDTSREGLKMAIGSREAPTFRTTYGRRRANLSSSSELARRASAAETAIAYPAAEVLAHIMLLTSLIGEKLL